MKIIGARVNDPRPVGEVAQPYLEVQVDEEPRAMGKQHQFRSGRHEIEAIQHGPFWVLDTTNGSKGWTEEDLVGMANMHLVDKLVPVEVTWPGDYGSYAMPVDRARTTMRKYRTGYKFTVSDVAARKGRIQWNLERDPVQCVGLRPNGEPCNSTDISDVIDLEGVQMPGCFIHISDLRGMARDLRLQRTRR